MTILFAQPYDPSATGFYFDSTEQYEERIKRVKNDFGEQPEEFEIQYIDGDSIDSRFADALGLNQLNFPKFLELVEEWEWHEKVRFIIAVGECGYDFDLEKDDIDCLDVDIYGVDSLKELAEQFVEEGLFGEIPEHLQFYIDYEKIARNLEVDYSETMIDGDNIVYRCG